MTLDDNDAIAREVAAARARGEVDHLADALARLANARVQQGRLRDAVASLDEAANLHAQRGRAYDQAQCLLFAGTALRLAGDLDGAREHAHRAQSLTETGSPQDAAINAELGEIALVSGEAEEAERSFARAVAGAATGRFHEKRALALSALGRWRDAAESAREARERYRASGEDARALAALVSMATALTRTGDQAEADRLTLEGLAESERLGARQPRAELRLLAVERAFAARDLATALQRSR
jgi:tetratricopeptide (TPR) repeat protein